MGRCAISIIVVFCFGLTASLASPLVNVDHVFLNKKGVIVFEFDNMQHTGIKEPREIKRIISNKQGIIVFVEQYEKGEINQKTYIFTDKARENLRDLIGQ